MIGRIISYRSVLEVKLGDIYDSVIREKGKWNKPAPFYFVRLVVVAPLPLYKSFNITSFSPSKSISAI